MSETRSSIPTGALPLALAALALALAWGCASPSRDAREADAAANDATTPGTTANDATTPAATPPPAASFDAEPRFFDVTAASGVDWTHDNGAFGERWLPETLGPGVILFEANGDQRLDLFLPNGGAFAGRPGDAALPALYLNQGGLRFVDQAREAGLAESHYCLGGSAADVDNDGDTDLFVTCLGRDLLYRNDGGRFTEIGTAAGMGDDRELAASAAFFDADNDGWADLYVTRYVRWRPEDDRDCDLFGLGESYCTPEIYPGLSGRFYRNRGDGTFEDRTAAAGMEDAQAKALGVIPVDYDLDGFTDLAVACDTTRNHLFHNLGDGTFEDRALILGVALSLIGEARGGMGISAGDYTGSGFPGLVISHFEGEMVGFFENRQSEILFDVGGGSDVGRKTTPYVGWGTFFFDYDLDGRLDLLVANGHLDPLADEAPTTSPWAQPQQLFHQLEDGSFVEVTETVGGDLAHPLVGRGAAWGDLDDDGDPDVVIATNGGPVKVFENRGPAGHWLRLRLAGRESHPDGLGARLVVRRGEEVKSAFVHTGGSYLSQSQLEPVFGLGETTVLDELEIHWPAGTIDRYRDVAADQVLRVVEGETRESSTQQISGAKP